MSYKIDTVGIMSHLNLLKRQPDCKVGTIKYNIQGESDYLNKLLQ